MSTPEPRQRSKSHDEGHSERHKKKSERHKGEKKSRSRSHDEHSKKKSTTRNGAKRHPSSGSISLEAGLSKLSGHGLLERRDFGRSAEDDDTFFDGEKKAGQLTDVQKTSPRNPFGAGYQTAMHRPDPFGGSAFGTRTDDDSSDEEDIDFFSGTANPFKDMKKRSSAKGTAL